MESKLEVFVNQIGYEADKTKFAYVTGLKGGEEFDILHTLGGKAAVEVIKGKKAVGCGSDMEDVFQNVKNLVESECAFGMEGYTFGRFGSDRSSNRMEEIVLREVKRYYEQTKRIITENRLFVGAVMATLLEKRIVTGKEIAKIRESVEESRDE